jgi:starch phosphorylase
MAKQKPTVAYLCMEFAITNDMKTYSGGLGILAGDYLKGAQEQNLPIIGVGIRWKQGYTSQKIDPAGKVQDCFRNYAYEDCVDTGVTVTVPIRQQDVTCRVWKVKDQAVKELYLLDADHPDNPDAWITGQLYGGADEQRVAQEMILGIGGVRALQAMGREPDLYHFNEGHAVLAALELIRQKREAGKSFAEAWAETREQVVFTTHTPVRAGNESHGHQLLQYLGANLGLTVEQMHEIGGTPFGMTVAALRLSKASNAVAQLHGETARNMWSDIETTQPLTGITNGIHRGTWVDERITKAQDNPKKIWDLHSELKHQLIEFIAARTGTKLRDDRLIIGFSRRAAPYKRSNLIFQAGDQILDAIKEGKIQVVFSGKAHPRDDKGKAIVEDIVRYSRELKDHVVFLEDYDMNIGAMLTRGSDVWLNNPRRPQEACGTSGMKAAMNGVLNLSTLDGWWPEACQHGVNGWAIGDDEVPETVAEQDKRDAASLGKVLLEEVLPTYYDNHDAWLKMMQSSIQTVTKPFSVETMLHTYYETLYR